MDKYTSCLFVGRSVTFTRVLSLTCIKLATALFICQFLRKLFPENNPFGKTATNRDRNANPCWRNRIRWLRKWYTSRICLLRRTIYPYSLEGTCTEEKRARAAFFGQLFFFFGFNTPPQGPHERKEGFPTAHISSSSQSDMFCASVTLSF